MSIQQTRSNADLSNRSTVNAQSPATQEPSELWLEKMHAWNKAFGIVGEALMNPAIDAYASLFGDCREVVKSTTDQIHENMKILREGMHDLGRASGPADYLKTGEQLREKLAKQSAKTGQTMMALAGDFAGKRFRASADLAVAAMEKSKRVPPRPPKA